MQAIADWLEKLGLSSTLSGLPRTTSNYNLRTLTDQDLKEIGVLARPST